MALRYRFLEKQMGYFNVRANEQRVSKIKYDIKDPYQIEYEKRIKTASQQMSDLIRLPESEINTDGLSN